MKPRIRNPSSAYIRTMNATGMFQRICRVTCSFIWAPAAKVAATQSLIRRWRMNSTEEGVAIDHKNLTPNPFPRGKGNQKCLSDAAIDLVVDRQAVVLDGFEPGGECVGHAGDAIGLARRQVDSLERVVDDIEELGRRGSRLDPLGHRRARYVVKGLRVVLRL